MPVRKTAIADWTSKRVQSLTVGGPDEASLTAMRPTPPLLLEAAMVFLRSVVLPELQDLPVQEEVVIEDLVLRCRLL